MSKEHSHRHQDRILVTPKGDFIAQRGGREFTIDPTTLSSDTRVVLPAETGSNEEDAK